MIPPTDMTEKERRAYTEIIYYDALKVIASEYKSADQVISRGLSEYGLEPIEALKMAYENMQEEAKLAIKGKRRPKDPRA